MANTFFLLIPFDKFLQNIILIFGKQVNPLMKNFNKSKQIKDILDGRFHSCKSSAGGD